MISSGFFLNFCSAIKFATQSMINAFIKFSKCCREFLNRFLFEKSKKIYKYFEQSTFFMKFCEETGFHGFRHIADRNYTAIERIGWMALVMLFTYFALSVCIDQVLRFIIDPFAFTLEINYNSWSYDIPAFTICTDYTNETFIDQYYQLSQNTTFIDYDSKAYHHYMTIIGALNAENIHSIEVFENTELFKSLTGEEIFDIALKQKFLNAEYDWIRPVVTEAGICWSMTNLFEFFMAIRNDSDHKFEKNYRLTRIICRSTRECGLPIEYTHPAEKAMIYFHSSNDILNMVKSPKCEWNPVTGMVQFFIDFNEVVTSNRSKMFGIESRKCRFDTETTSNRSYPLGLYTQNLCLMECSVDAAINLCGCQPFFYKIGAGPICNISGM